MARRCSIGSRTSTSASWSPTRTTTPSTPARACPGTTCPTPIWCGCTTRPGVPDVGAHEHEHRHHDHGDEHEHPTGVRGWVSGLFHPHSHDAADSVDSAL